MTLPEDSFSPDQIESSPSADGAKISMEGLASGSSPRLRSGQALGMVVGGSLSEGVEVKLDEGASVEEIPVGSYVVIQGERKRFLGMGSLSGSVSSGWS